MTYSDQVSAMLSDAARQEEYMSLAGLDAGDLLTDEERAAGADAPLVGYAELEQALRDGLAELSRLRSHAHAWDNDQRCTICGADGLA